MAALGTGQRFAALKSSLASRPGVRNPGALAAYIGRKKYGATGMGRLSHHESIRMGSTGNVLRKKTLAEHITGLRSAGAFGKRNTSVAPITGFRGTPAQKNSTVQPVTGWRTPKRAYSQDPATGVRDASGVGSRAKQPVTGIRDHSAVHGSQAPKKNAIVGD